MLKLKLYLYERQKNLNTWEVRYVQPLKKLVSEILRAKELSYTNDLREIKEYLRSITEVRILKDRKITLELIYPLNTLMNQDEIWNWKPETLTKND